MAGASSGRKVRVRKPRNLFESSIQTQLRRAKVRFKYESERIPYILARHYIPDFIIETPRGKVYVECKGYLRPADRSKLMAVRRQHPELDIRIVFYENRKTNCNWAIRAGIPYAIGKIPVEWMN